MATITIIKRCTGCKRTETKHTILEACPRCEGSLYCCDECRVLDLKAHEPICAATRSAKGLDKKAPAQSPEPSWEPQLDVIVEQPFHKLQAKTWLHGRSEQDVYKLLVDTYRLRLDEECAYPGLCHSIRIPSNTEKEMVEEFRRFLELAELRTGLLPTWWSDEKAIACVAFGTAQGEQFLDEAVMAKDIMDKYRNQQLPLQLRILGEQVYGTGPGGYSSYSRMERMIMIEADEDPLYVFHGEVLKLR